MILLMIVLAFFLGFCFRKMMGGQLIEGSEDSDSGTALAGETCIKDYYNIYKDEYYKYGDEYKCAPMYQREVKTFSIKDRQGWWKSMSAVCCAKYSGEGNCNTDYNSMVFCDDDTESCYEGNVENANPYYIGTCMHAGQPCHDGLPDCDSINEFQ